MSSRTASSISPLVSSASGSKIRFGRLDTTRGRSIRGAAPRRAKMQVRRRDPSTGPQPVGAPVRHLPSHDLWRSHRRRARARHTRPRKRLVFHRQFVGERKPRTFRMQDRSRTTWTRRGEALVVSVEFCVRSLDVRLGASSWGLGGVQRRPSWEICGVQRPGYPGGSASCIARAERRAPLCERGGLRIERESMGTVQLWDPPPASASRLGYYFSAPFASGGAGSWRAAGSRRCRVEREARRRHRSAPISTFRYRQSASVQTPSRVTLNGRDGATARRPLVDVLAPVILDTRRFLRIHRRAPRRKRRPLFVHAGRCSMPLMLSALSHTLPSSRRHARLGRWALLGATIVAVSACSTSSAPPNSDAPPTAGVRVQARAGRGRGRRARRSLNSMPCARQNDSYGNLSCAYRGRHVSPHAPLRVTGVWMHGGRRGACVTGRSKAIEDARPPSLSYDDDTPWIDPARTQAGAREGGCAR